MQQLIGSRVVLARTIAEHVGELQRIRRTPEVRARWGNDEEAADWRFDYPEDVPFTVFLNDRICGLIQFGEETKPGYRHATIDLFLDPVLHGEGHGRDAIRSLALPDRRAWPSPDRHRPRRGQRCGHPLLRGGRVPWNRTDAAVGKGCGRLRMA